MTILREREGEGDAGDPPPQRLQGPTESGGRVDVWTVRPKKVAVRGVTWSSLRSKRVSYAKVGARAKKIGGVGGREKLI